MKKRALSLLLTLVLCVGLCVPALAAEGTSERGVLTYTETIAPQYEDARQFYDGLAAVKKDGKWGYIDEDNNVVIDFQYDLAYGFSEGYAIVGTVSREEETWEWETCYDVGFIDKEGSYTPFMDPGGAYVNGNYMADPYPAELWDYYDSLPDSIWFHNGMAKIEGNMYRTDGSRVIFRYADGSQAYYYATGPLNEGLIPITEIGMGFEGFADSEGKIVKLFDEELESLFDLSELSADGGVVTEVGGTYLSPATSFDQGLAVARKATYFWVEFQDEEYGKYEEEWWKWRIGFIDHNYNWVIEPQYTSYFYRDNDNGLSVLFGDTGLAMVRNADDLYGAIDKEGNVVIPFQYEELWPINNGLMVFLVDGKYGYLDAATLEVAIAPQYEKASGFNDVGLAAVYDGQNAFLIDKKGQVVPGTDQLDPSTYFIEYEDGSRNIVIPGEYVVIQRDGKYGFGHIEYLPPLPEVADMSDWAYPEVVGAIEEDLVPSYLQNLYRNNITRNEFCDLVMETLEEVTGKTGEALVMEKTGRSLDDWRHAYPFTDTTSATVIAANALGIINGRGNGTFDPYAPITRQEAAALLTRTAGVLGMDTASAADAGFVDSAQVGEWFTDAVNFVAQINVMGGTGNNAFTPLGSYTREQSYITAYRLFQAVSANR